MSQPARLIYLDRLVTNRTTGVSAVYAGGVATWTLPFNVATDASEGALIIVRADTFEVFTSTRPAANQIAVATAVDLTVCDVYIGILYESLYRLSKVYLRDENNRPITRGRLNLGMLAVRYEDTTDLTARITAAGRSARSYTVDKAALTDGILRAPVHCQNEDATIELLTSTHGAFNIASIDWEGEYHGTGRPTR